MVVVIPISKPGPISKKRHRATFYDRNVFFHFFVVKNCDRFQQVDNIRLIQKILLAQKIGQLYISHFSTK